MTWRSSRPKWLCKKHGHVEWEPGVSNIGGFLLCGCGRWFPMDDPNDPGTDSIITHPRYSLNGLIGYNGLTIGQPPLSYATAQSMAMPFVFLRDNPDELEKMNFTDIRALIIDRLADYEEGMDVE